MDATMIWMQSAWAMSIPCALGQGRLGARNTLAARLVCCPRIELLTVADRRMVVFGQSHRIKGIRDSSASAPNGQPLRMALEKFWAPVPWMLEAAIVLEVLDKYVEAAIIAGLLVFNAALGLFQESRAQVTLAALKDLTRHRAGERPPPVFAGRTEPPHAEHNSPRYRR
jgi:hypothetical protein